MYCLQLCKQTVTEFSWIINVTASKKNRSTRNNRRPGPRPKYKNAQLNHHADLSTHQPMPIQAGLALVTAVVLDVWTLLFALAVHYLSGLSLVGCFTLMHALIMFNPASFWGLALTSRRVLIKDWDDDCAGLFFGHPRPGKTQGACF